MKKNMLTLLAVILLGTFQANAQLGVKIGYNFAKMSGDVEAGYTEKSLNNVHFGVFMDKDLIPLLDLRVGLDYSPKGYRDENGDLYNQLQLNYLEVPVQAKVKLGPMYVLGGFYGAYAMKGKIEDETTSDDLDFDASQTKKFDYGMKFGLGFQVGLGPLHAFAQGEYSFGLQNLSKVDGVDNKNKVIGASVGVIIGF